jgi:imidazolonepropionase-like amidohydrolase
MRVALLLAALAIAPPAYAKAIVITADRLFDGRSDVLQKPGRVVIDGGKIIGVGPKAAAPADAETIALGDATLVPGLMDAHTHLSEEMSEDWKQDELDFFKKPIPQFAIEASVFARRTLEAGFTTVRDLGSAELIDIGLRNAINVGKVPGPRILASVKAISARGGHCDPTGGYRPGLMKEPDTTEGVANGPDEIRAAVRYNCKHGADVIKVCASGGVLSLNDKVDSPQLTQAELDALVDEAHALGRKAAAHAHGNEAIKRAVRAGIDSIEHGTFADDEALRMMKAKGTYLVYTPTPCLEERMKRNGAPANVVAKATAAAQREEDMFRRALKMGVSVAFGTDAAVCPHGSQWQSMANMAKNGMKPLAILRAATSVDAQLFGVADTLGALEPGKIADVVAIAGDPSTDIRSVQNVRLVVKAGEIVKR